MTLKDYRIAGVSIGIFTYLPIVGSAIELLSCQTIVYQGVEVQVLRSFPDSICWQGKHVNAVLLSVVVLSILLILKLSGSKA